MGWKCSDRLRAVASLSCALGLCAPATVRADFPQPRVALRLHAPSDADCAGRAEIEARVARISRRRFVASGDPYSYAIAVDVTAAPGDGFAARVQLEDRSGDVLGTRRVLGRSPSCRELDVPVGVVVATMLDSLEGPTDEAPQRDDAPAVAPPPPPPPASGLALGAFATAVAALGSEISWGAGLEVGLPLAVPLVVDLSAYAPAELVSDSGTGVRLQSLHGGVGVCPSLLGETTRLDLCLGVQAGALWSRGLGLDVATPRVSPLLLVGAEPKLVVEVFRGALLRLSLAAQWMAVRPRIRWEIIGEGERTLHGQPFVFLARIGIIGILPLRP